MDRRDNLPELHVDIDPGFERIVEFHAQHGEWRLPAAGVVVRVVIAKHLLVDDPLETWVYVDVELGQVVATIHRLNRLERWLYNGLHSLDFGFWYDKRPLWDIGMIALSLGALVMSTIGLWFGMKRVKVDFKKLTRRGPV